ncbi:sulfite reductase subunit alpha [Methylobacillus arboreus]|uniref:sulfite reductase subunit alpha n=1 Tax=Methylobacillus arboreus TaxID=755170 RepID=UPI001E4DB142|nr:sulfite reductase subunit alpha [Methylobacillus arboreus]MCB5191096.1 sulfite reductase subunit alpha [Methylobacillus arboreus]
MTEVKSVCPYCGVGCGIVMQVDAGRIIKVAGDKQHPSNFGRLCTKGSSCIQAITNGGRLEHAYARSQRGMEPVRTDIQKAIEMAGTRLRAIVDEHGPDSVALYVSGQMSLEAQYLANKLIKGYIGSNNIESNSRLCMASAGTGYKQSLGADGPPGSYQDFDTTDLIFVIGANMADCHPILFLRMMDRVKAGAKLIVVDPRRNATADKASLFMQIRPGTDLALLNGLLHLIIKNGHTDPEFIAEFTEGWDAMPEFLQDYPPEKVAEITGIPEADIRKAAEWIGTAPNWMSCWTMGLNQSTHGTWHTNLICNLHLATGAICKPGSGPFSLTGQPNAMGGREMGYMGPGLPGQRAVMAEQDRKFVEKAWGVPEGTLRTETGSGTIAMYEDMAAGKIKACWIICTNPVATTPNRKTTIAGLEKAELVITQDAFIDTETNRHADILLPGALWAEADGVMINSERNLTLMPKAVDPPGDAMPDWKIIASIATAMGYGDGFNFSSAEEVFEEVKLFWNPKTGYDIRGASYARLRETPLQWPIPPGDTADRHPIRYINDGISQALLEKENGTRPRLAFATESRKGIFFARPYMTPAELPDDEYPIVLNTGRMQHQWHTMTKTGKIPTLNKLNPGPFVEINPQDAKRLGIADKDQVEIRSRRGLAILPAIVTGRVLPGNCFAPFHWNDLFGENLCINAVTNDAVDPASLQPELKFCAVTLSRVAAQQVQTKQEPDEETSNTGTGPSAAHTIQYSCKELAMEQIDTLSTMLGLGEAPSPSITIALNEHEHLYLQGYLATLRSDAARQAGGVPFIPATSPLAPARRMIVNGMLAGMFARSYAGDDSLPTISHTPAAQSGATIPKSAPVLILWASQTGNAEAFAIQCAKQLQHQGYATTLMEMNAAKPTQLASAPKVLLLTSTFGDGDPPDNASEFWAELQGDSAPSLAGANFSVLAFGDSSYDQFCGYGKALDARLEALGAQRLYPRADCEPDDEETAITWLDGVTQALSTIPVAATAKTGLADASAGNAPIIEYSRKHPLSTKLTCNRLLNSEGATKETRQFGFDLSGSALHYDAGDALGVWPRNNPERVQELIQAMGLNGTTSVTIKDHGPMPLAQALAQHIDIARITTGLLEFVYVRNKDSALAELLNPENAEALKKWLWGRHIADLLLQFPIKATAEEWLGVLKGIQPRLYSISSSAKTTPDEVQLTVSVVRYDCEGRPRGGVCSTFLADDAENSGVSIFVQKSAHFHPPQDSTKPIIMVGPGTGIAPFRAFLLDRQASGAGGKNWLFFGDQHAATDFYYRDELSAMQQSGLLTRLDTAFSRDQAEKIYVQNRMLEHGAELWTWLQEGAHFYVCGDASRMAKDVDAALVQIVHEHGKMDEKSAQAYVKQMASDKRYVRDVY